MTDPPPAVPSAVRDAFGLRLRDEAVRSAGGEGLSVRVGDVVLKRVHDVDEANWIQEVQSRLVEDGFRLARPVSTIAGQWTYGGWSATQFIPGLWPVAPPWQAVAALGLRFSDAATAAVGGDGAGVEALTRRTHRWAVADRFAWGETDLELTPEAADIYVHLVDLLGDPPTDRQIVHGDLAGNVHIDPAGVPVILDFSPYVRPRAWAAALVVADATLWHGADLSLTTSFAATPVGRDLLARALIFRLAAEPPATTASTTRPSKNLHSYRRVLPALT